MNVTVDRESFVRALARVQGVVDKRHALAMLTNVLVECDERSLSVVATDLEVSLRQTSAAKVKKPGRVATSARTLFEVVREASAEEITLKSLENQWLEVVYGKSKFKLTGVDPDEHPGMPQTSRKRRQGGQHRDRFGRSRRDGSEDRVRGFERRYALQSFRGVSDEGRQEVDAQDGRDRWPPPRGDRSHGRRRGPAGRGHPASQGSRRARQAARREHGQSHTLTIAGSECVASDRRQCPQHATRRGKVSRLPESDSRGAHADRPCAARCTAAAASPGLDHVERASAQRAAECRIAARLDVSASNPDMGEATEEVPVDYRGDKLEVGFNAKYLIDVLTVLARGKRRRARPVRRAQPGRRSRRRCGVHVRRHAAAHLSHYRCAETPVMTRGFAALSALLETPALIASSRVRSASERRP